MEVSTDFSGAMPDDTFVIQNPYQIGLYAPPGGVSQDGMTDPAALPHPRPIWPSTSEVAAEYRHILAARQGQEASSHVWGNGTSAGHPPVIGSMSSTRVSGTEGGLVMGHNRSGACYSGALETFHDRAALAETGTATDAESSGLNRLNQSRH
jgi:hypothetical protein